MNSEFQDMLMATNSSISYACLCYWAKGNPKLPGKFVYYILTFMMCLYIFLAIASPIDYLIRHIHIAWR